MGAVNIFLGGTGKYIAEDLQASALIKLVNMNLALARPRAALVFAAQAYGVARAAPSDRALSRAATGIGLSHADIGPLQRGVRWLRRAHRIAQRCGDRPTESVAALHLADHLFEAGDLRGAWETARRTVALDDGLYRSRASRRSRAVAARILARRGDAAARATLSAHAGNALEQAPREVAIAEVMALAEIQRSLGNTEEALNLVSCLRSLVEHHRASERSLLVDILPLEGDLAFALGRAESLTAVRKELSDRFADRESEIPIVAAEMRRLDGCAFALSGEWSSAAACWEEAAALFGRNGYHWRQERALLLAGVASVQLGEVGRAALILRATYEAFRDMGAPAEMRAARVLLHDIRRRPPSQRPKEGTLTPREREIARLAAEDLTNAQIASRLSISERTAATHMHNILVKLDLKSRVQLGLWLAQHPA
jgi:DNA-binding CsgD family transcriptional regulator